MSLASLADEEILRTDRKNLDPSTVVGPHLADLMRDLGVDPALAPQAQTALQPIAAADPLAKTPASGAIDALARYIPTESITLYIAGVSAISAADESAASAAHLGWVLYLGFVALTPVLFLLVYGGKRRSAKLPPFPKTAGEWPWWKLVAATIAFAAWALAAPPLVESSIGKIAAAFGAILVSTLLSLIGAVVEPPGNG